MKKLKALSILAVFLLGSGCATILSGGSSDIRIDSEPGGSSVYVDGIQRGASTPTTINLDHSYSDVWDNKTITLRQEGYEERTFEIDLGISGWYWGNALFPIGGAVAGNAVTSDNLQGASEAAQITAVGALVGTIGWITDLVTGSWVNTDRNQYSVEMREGMAKLDSRGGSFYTEYNHISVSELKKNDDGNYIIPDHEKPLVVYDSEMDKTMIFRKNK